MPPSRDPHSTLRLPPVPADQAGSGVAGWREPVLIDTYEPAEPDPYPAYLESRVYQGSSGRVYPLPCHERIATSSAPRQWDAVHLENEWIRLMVLPELGGRIHVGYDKIRGYDFFYRNNVIKPGLVGLAGPWIAGGVEFNWPQHHRPGTFLPVDVVIEREPDGAVTVWCSDHDPFARMKGAHGIRLRPQSAVVEARVRLYNRSEEVQTFLWWANVAVRVNDEYQSFFPTDVHYVADHAKRAMASFPRVRGRYYGVDYPARVSATDPDGDRLDWYRNIPVPTSYMCVGSEDDFFGGYDHGAKAGFVHWADHRIAPGKKQWTWGNSPFGRAWERHLTDADGPYVELMAGVYTDNQPDFSFLAPGETKVFSQYWYPFGLIGPVQQANLDAAVTLSPVGDKGGARVRVGVAVTAPRPDSTVTLVDGQGQLLWQQHTDLSPQQPLLAEVPLANDLPMHELELTVRHQERTLLRWHPRRQPEQLAPPEPANAPPDPEQVATVEELYLTGLHLHQYRHATRSPEQYWTQALRRDPDDTRCNVALAGLYYGRGEYERAEGLLRRAVRRLTTRNPNPYDGQAHYLLGLTLLRMGRPDAGYDMLAKAAWNAAWRAPAQLAIARLECAAGRWGDALAHLDHALAAEADALQARDLRVLVLRRLDRGGEAEAELHATLALDPLDWWARDLAGEPLRCDAPTCLDVALEYATAGCTGDALRVLDAAGERLAEETTPAGGVRRPRSGLAPLLAYHRADLLAAGGDMAGAAAAAAQARTADPTYCFPSRLADADVLTRALRRDPDDPMAAALLGHWLYDRHRHAEAIAHWSRSAKLDPGNAVVWRNLGIAAYNIRHDPAQAVEYYQRAHAVAPADARLCYELDQLAKRIATPPAQRLAMLRRHPAALAERDDLTVELAELLLLSGAPEQAMAVLTERYFQPWEGGEGRVLRAWEQTSLALARAALAAGAPGEAEQLLRAALDPPTNLGEARHPLANDAELQLVLGDIRAARGEGAGARSAWSAAASADGDFQQMSVTEFSENTYFSALALRRLGRPEQAEQLTAQLARYVQRASDTPAVIDYFATSLPSMLLFTEDLQQRNDLRVALLAAQLDVLHGRYDAARAALSAILARDPSQLSAAMLLSQLAEPRHTAFEG